MNMKKKKRKTAIRFKTMTCREGVYYLAAIAFVFIAALIRQMNPMLLFASLLICPLFLAWRMGRQNLQQLTVKRKVPKRVHAGDTFVAQIELRNSHRKFSSWSIVAEDHIETVRSGLNLKQPIQHPAVYFEHVEPRGERRKNYIGRLPHRGLYRLRHITLSTRFPCGFFRSWTQVEESEEMLVLPRIGKLSASWISRQHEATENKQRRKYMPSRVTGEFLGVRHWQHGDAKRWIHWRASARHNQPVIKQFERHQNQDTAILLDLYHHGDYNHGDVASRAAENIELAVCFAATLAIEIIRRGGCNLLFGTYSQKHEIFHGQATVSLLEQILDHLAVIAPSSDDCLAEMLLDALAESDPNADLVLITDRPVNLNDQERFRRYKNDPRLRILAQRLRVVDVSDRKFSEIFEV